MECNNKWGEEDSLSIYEEEDLYELLEDDEITLFEAGFMRGYLAA